MLIYVQNFLMLLRVKSDADPPNPHPWIDAESAALNLHAAMVEPGVWTWLQLGLSPLLLHSCNVQR